MPKSRKKKRIPKRVLALSDLEESKTAVLNSLTSNPMPDNVESDSGIADTAENRMTMGEEPCST